MRPARAGIAPLVVAGVVAAALVAGYLALGGGSYKPLTVADPCKPRALPRAKGAQEISQQILLSALDGAACRLRVTREELALALASADSRRRFASGHRITESGLEAAVRDGLRRAVGDFQRAGRLSAGQAAILRGAVSALPISQLMDALRAGRDLSGDIGALLGALK